MRWCSLLILFVPLSATGEPGPDVVKKDLQQFQGSWRAISIHQADGRPATEDEIKNARLVVDGTKFTLKGKDFTINGSFTIDPTKTPKTIDVVLTGDDGTKTTFLGIYRIQGETRKSSFALEGARPTQFSPKKGHLGFEWTRNQAVK